jgi:integrase
MAKTISSGVTIREHKPGRYRASLSFWTDVHGRVFTHKPLTGGGSLTRKRIDVYGATVAEVRQKLKEAENRIDQKRPPKDVALAFQAYADRWVTSGLENSDRRTNTKNIYRHLLANLSATSLGAKDIGAIVPSDINRALVELKDLGFSDATRRQTFVILKALYADAIRDRLVAYDPTTELKTPKVAFQEAQFFTADQLRDIFEAGTGRRYTEFFRLIALTGLRKGEALALRWSDIDLENRTLTVRHSLSRNAGELVLGPTKNARSRRTLELSDRLIELLKAWRLQQKEERLKAGSQYRPSAFLITTQLGGPVDPRSFLRDFQVLTKLVGLGGSVHTLRHSAASLMIEIDVPLAVISRVLGHSSISVTVDTYGHLTKDSTAQALSKLSLAV